VGVAHKVRLQEALHDHLLDERPTALEGALERRLAREHARTFVARRDGVRSTLDEYLGHDRQLLSRPGRFGGGRPTHRL